MIRPWSIRDDTELTMVEPDNTTVCRVVNHDVPRAIARMCVHELMAPGTVDLSPQIPRVQRARTIGWA